MSYDGSSAKSYIRHPTEKERLDNLAFASFPEDYLPYASTAGHSRTSAPPPYLLWGEDRRRRKPKKRRNPKCAGALLCAITLVVFAIIVVIAISIYLGVVTKLFRSPVVSVSGRFLASEDFSEELLNSSSPKFLEKADFYQAKVEKAFISSSLEPAFIAARIYSFRPGLVVFFRVYLDRRKIKQEESTASPPTELVRELVAQKLTADPDSVHVEENEELLSIEIRQSETIASPSPSLEPPLTATKSTAEKNGNRRQPASGGVGEWRPVPIEDSVSPSFINSPSGGVGSVRSPEEVPRRIPEERIGSVRVPNNTPSRNTPVSNNDGIGTATVLEALPSRKPHLNKQGNTGNIRQPQETPVRRPQGIPQGGISSTESKESAQRNHLSNSDRGEGVGSVRLIHESPSDIPEFSNHPVGVGSIRVIDAKPDIVPMLPGSTVEGLGTVRLTDDRPKKETQFLGDPRAGLGTVRVHEDIPSKKLSSHVNPSRVSVHSQREPPTLAPSVSLVVRNRSRSDKPRNLLSRLEKERENVGVGSIREVPSEGDLPLPLQKEPPEFASRLLQTDSEIDPGINSGERDTSKVIVDRVGNFETHSQNISTEMFSTTQNFDSLLEKETESLRFSDIDSSQNESNSSTELISTLSDIDNETMKSPQSTEFRTSLENILFSHPTLTTATTKETFTEETTAESSTSDTFIENNNKRNHSENIESILLDSVSLEKEEIDENETLSPTTENADIHSSIVNYSQYLYPDPHFHAIENERNTSSEESFEFHTLKGHGFHKPANSSSDRTSLKPIKIDSTTQTTITISLVSSTEKGAATNTSKEDSTSSLDISMTTESEPVVESSTHNLLGDIGNSSNATASVKEIDGENNATADDTSQQGKVVPQMQPDFISNDIEEQQQSNEDSNESSEDEILRHITTIHPFINGNSTVIRSCPSGSVPCNTTGEGCGIRCDLRRDCSDNEDETGCMCSDLLRAMGQSQKICDGVNDCSDKSDEKNCSWCPSADYFRCPGSRTCITLDRVCDGKDDCPGAQDEKRCVSLAETSPEAETHEYHPEGYLIVRRSGQWGKLCLNSLTRLQDHETRIRELGKAVCHTLTYRNMTSSVRAKDKEGVEDTYFQISTEVASNKSAAGSSIFMPTACKSRDVLRVQCKSLECGLRPSAIATQRRRIVGGKSADNVGSWPWAAALYREGDFQCGAALISEIWLVSAGHCFYSSRHAYWSARLGVLRRGSELLSGEEHVRRIQNIILHPQYEDVGFINDIALLKMDKPVPFSDSLRPICLPSSPAEDASLWHGRRCTVVGWGKLYEIGHTFPDSLQEVRLPVISSTECQKRSIFLPAYRITPDMFCAGYERGGRDACLGDSGGPMACQRPADGRWILLGVTSNGDGCGRPGRPGVYSQVASFLSWIEEIIAGDGKELSGNTGTESSCSKGIRCRLGRCIQQARICDSRRDCAGGEDEENCK